MNKVTKLNPSIDIIPLQGSSSDPRFKTMNNRRPGLNPSSIYGDSLILDRVQTVRKTNYLPYYIIYHLVMVLECEYNFRILHFIFYFFSAFNS